MKQLVVFFLIGFLAVKAIGQPSVDIGIFGGTGTYFGDMTKTELSKSINPAYGGFFRYNFNPRYAVRFNVLNGTIGADGQFINNPWNFNKNVLDISLSLEFNFLKYIVGEKETPWSTFIMGGIGMQMFNYEFRYNELSAFLDPTYLSLPQSSSSEISPTIPFGLGIKYDLSKRIGLGIEGSFRKSFSDKLDDLDDPLSYVTDTDVPVQIKYTDQWHNNDWTAYVGIHLVYKLIYGNKDWEVRTPRKKMNDWGIWNSIRKE
ncbi:MAG: DUF6089 family protein [Prolixibacteraceae bacterium]